LNVEIPKGDFDAPAPCWLPIQQDGKALKPLIKCNCGHILRIGLHHVHSDGTVTASFFHDAAAHPDIGYAGGGCGWHVFLKLKDYDQGDFPPVR
jgi:hypothetical protein